MLNALFGSLFILLAANSSVAKAQANPAVPLWGGPENDCNGNGIPDADDIATGASFDCNNDGAPDECDVMMTCDISPRQQLFASNLSEHPRFGASLSLSGTTAIVGAPGDGCDFIFCDPPYGAAVTFHFDGTDWVEQQKLTVVESIGFGSSVSIDGNLIVIGGAREDCGTGSACGAAYVYRFDGEAWNQEAMLVAPKQGAWAGFGETVAVDGETIVVGDTSEGCADGGACGIVYVFRHDANGWNVVATLTAPNPTGKEGFGHSVSIDGNRIVCAAPGGQRAIVFEYDGAAWIVSAILSTPGTSWGDAQVHEFVTIRGEIIVVGAQYYYDPVEQTPIGAAHVFRRIANGWVAEQTLTASNAASSAQFGTSVAVGVNLIVVGAAWAHCNVATWCGATYLYQHDGTQWSEVGRFVPSNLTDSSFFGEAVAVSGDVAIAGGALFGWGGIYAFDLPYADCNCNTVSDVCDGGDINDDATVDLVDFSEFVPCLLGPGNAPDGCCSFFDLNRDNHVDLIDLAGFQLAFTGSP